MPGGHLQLAVCDGQGRCQKGAAAGAGQEGAVHPAQAPLGLTALRNSWMRAGRGAGEGDRKEQEQGDRKEQEQGGRKEQKLE